MESLKQLEKTIEGWLKPLPHMPADWRKWLSDNAWWLAIVGVVVDVFAMINIYKAATILDSLYSYAAYWGVKADSGWTTSLTVSIVLLGVMAAIMAMAISPLKAHKKRGWDLMFLATGVSIVSSLATAILGGDITSVLMSIVGAFIGVYILFELKSHFNGATVVHKEK